MRIPPPPRQRAASDAHIRGHARHRSRLLGSSTVACTLIGAFALIGASPALAITGGDESDTPEPWVASVQFGGDHHCTGTLIDENWVLTAYHCVAVELPEGVRLGSNDHTEGEFVGIEEVINHPDAWFDPETREMFGPDLALLKLSETTTIEPMRVADELPDRSSPMKTFGWGFLDWDATPTTLLHELDVTLSPAGDCPPANDYAPARLCMIDPSGSGIVPGDSGGPLIADTAEGRRLVGTSNSAAPGVSVWTDVTLFSTWIQDQIRTGASDLIR
ncbi:S1 family peptidase [Microbacterium sp. NPDC089695]|uniref:S1 family peptidase n=1 Tax=Microbacterium sp. NPDC089695 TaxID=3364198 RepID=UPI003822ADF1